MGERESGSSPANEYLAHWLRKSAVDERAATPWVAQRGRSVKQYLTALKIAMINSGEAQIAVDHYGRVHSSISNLRRTVRTALRINGQPITEVDVSCAQPLILGFIVAKLLAGDWSLADVKRLGTKGELSEPFQNLPMTRWSTDLPPDLLNYFEVCQRGRFYHALAEVWGMPCQAPKEKSAVKGLAFRLILFGRVRPMSCQWKAFLDRWPSLAVVLEQLKREDHGTTARASQRIESHLMVAGVVERFRRLYPTVPIQLLYDGVMVPPHAVDLAREAINLAWGAIGLAPSIKPERSVEVTAVDTQVEAV
jgi:hypothetical protein